MQGLKRFITGSTQPAITYSKLTIETLEQGVKHVNNKKFTPVSILNFEQVNAGSLRPYNI